MRRLIGILCMLGVLVWAFVVPPIGGEGLHDKAHVTHFFHRDSTDSLIDEDYNATIRMYCSQCADTTGTTIWSSFHSDTTWHDITIPYGIYKILYESDSATIVLRDSLLIPGRTAPDTFIIHSGALWDTVVAAHSIQLEAVQPRHIHQDSSYTFSYNTTVDSLTANWVSSDSVWATWVNADTVESNKWVLFDSADGDSLLVDSLYARHAAIDSLEADSIWAYKVWCDSFFVRDSSISYFQAAIFDSVYFPSDCVVGGALNVTSGKIDIDIVPSSGSGTLIETEDALQVKYSVVHFSESGLGLVLAEDGVDTDHLKDYNPPLPDDFATFKATKQIEWKTHAEAAVAKIIGSGYADMPNGAVDTLMIYATGALTSDDCLCSFSGEPAWMTGLDVYPASLGCSVAVADSVKVLRSPDGNRTFAEGELTFFWMVLRNP